MSEELSADSPVDGAMTYEYFLERYLGLPRLEKKKYKHLFTERSHVRIHLSAPRSFPCWRRGC